MQQHIMYSLYVGKYENPAATKTDVAKLNKMGLRAFVFSRGDHYALKVFSSPIPELIDKYKRALRSAGFFVEVEEINIKQSLHLN